MAETNTPDLDKVPETKGMYDKVPETKGYYQVISKKLKDAEIEIIFQMEIDNGGNTTITVFKGNTPMPAGEQKP